VLEEGLQLFQLQGRGNAEHALFPVETAVRHQDMAVWFESEIIAEGSDNDDCAGEGIRGRLAARCAAASWRKSAPYSTIKKD